MLGSNYQTDTSIKNINDYIISKANDFDRYDLTVLANVVNNTIRKLELNQQFEEVLAEQQRPEEKYSVENIHYLISVIYNSIDYADVNQRTAFRERYEIWFTEDTADSPITPIDIASAVNELLLQVEQYEESVIALPSFKGIINFFTRQYKDDVEKKKPGINTDTIPER